ncbi:MAG TPA: MerR family transcriptional regulator [Acidimicrobiales bacterium]
MAQPGSLFIGDVTALTGITAGRIRHYESIGLISPDHLDSGYRTFRPDDVLLLLRIDLLRSLGMGLEAIRACLNDEQETLHAALVQHRLVLDDERRRIESLLEAVDHALGQTDDDPSGSMARLATSQRDSIGMFGRLSRPLSGRAAAAYLEIFSSWELPVPPLFGQMVLPEQVTELLERLVAAPGHEMLFARLRSLATQVVGLPPDDDDTTRRLAREWVAEQLASPFPEAVAVALDDFVPRLADLTVIQQGLRAWSESLSPQAGTFMHEVEAESARRNAWVLGVIVVPR